MALSDIIINDVVRFQTNAVISESDFQNLRQYLLNREPLLTVTNSIDVFLREHFSADKQTAIEEMAKAACDSQRTSDVKEARADEQEKNNDALLRSNYSQELPSLDNKKSQLDTRIYQQQNYHNQIRSQVSEYKINRDQITQTIARIQSERNIINSRYILNATFPHGHMHTHGQVHTHGHMHTNGTVHTHYPNAIQFPNTIPTMLSFQDQITLDSLAREENRLNDERSRLTRLIDSKDVELFSEGQQLSTIITEKRQTENRYRELKRQLEVELPNRELQRQTRSQERAIREEARATDDTEMLQLSDKNREALKQRITAKIAELDKTRERLMKSATDTSYPIFIEQLDEVLCGAKELEITYGELEALKSIQSKMKKYSEMEQLEQKITRSLQDTKGILSTLQQNLSESTSKLQRYETSNPQLKQTNAELAEDNRRLQPSSEASGSMRTNALYWSLFGGTSSVISAAVIGSLVVSPIFFAISGVLALATVISLTVAGVYHFQKSACDDKIEHNNKTIRTNESIISAHDKEAVTLRSTTIPSLRNTIEETSQSIGQMDKKLKELQQGMKQLFTKAQNVIELPSSSNGFFGNQSSNVVHLRASSQGLPQYEDSSSLESTDTMEFPYEQASTQQVNWFRGFGNS
jgi:hypothetical protein